MERDLIRISKETPKQSDNLLQPFCTFDDVHTWNIVSGIGDISVSNSTDYVYSGDRSLKVTFITGSPGSFDSGGSEMSFTAQRTGTYIVSTAFLVPDDFVDTDVAIHCYVNGILLATNILQANLFDSTDSNWVWDSWNTYSQTIDLSVNDVLTFRFAADSDTAGSTLYIDRLKLEFDDKELGIPSVYSLPKDFCCSDGKVNLVETQWDVPDVGPQVVANGASLNLLTLINNATHKNLTNSDTFDQLNIVSNAIKTTYRDSKTIHLVRLSFNILVGTDQFYQIQIRRAIDDSVVYRLQIQRNADESIQTVEMTTRTLSASDPFTIDGFYVAFVNNSGASVTIDDSLSLVIISTYQKQQTP